METILLLIVAYIFYYFFAFFTKFLVFKITSINSPYISKEKNNKLTIFLSPDFISSDYFKTRIKINENDGIKKNTDEANKLSAFIQNANFCNLIISTTLALIAFVLVTVSDCKNLHDVIIYVALFRFCSRSIEIAQAFYKDTTQKCTNRNSSLDKYDRIKLAMISYVEIYIYSAPAYLFLCGNNIKDAITLSLNVGSLTNVGMAFSACSDFLNIIVFVQVFTTMILVILSLASYISRPETE